MSLHLVGVVGNLLDSVLEIGNVNGFVIRVRDGIGCYSLPSLDVVGGDVEMVGSD